ncbi:uncharacterized protein C05D11.1-like [Ischnura elegans]|uniref:uncharacterized protein C05D11.1-like n=1 Tax=Ischnura elegans TaxID=197161 RepID=UPI001ED8BA2E|nr:uncharacterized protein C05D11.1-like [Ischnura elegans]
MAPVDSSPARADGANYELICSLKANDIIPVHKYRSRTTGLTVAIAEVEGPLVNGYFCLPTETYDDDGLPHTLEHLIFLGSEKYPYKGTLDLLANRCLGSGTNAWTDTDHTCYTMTTAGSDGFLTLMPIYLDHILYPTLTDAGFVTEVHHITGEGEDAGVVYCEMQGIENTGESLVHLAMLRALYPGHCGYKSQTGGVMKNLRESTTNVKVRNYHKEYYRPENLTVIITGQVKPNEVFRALAPVEETILSKGERGLYKRPWQSPVPPLEKSVDLLVEFPNDDEDNGMVYVAWRGPSAVKELYKMCACSIILKYLTDTSVSPLQKAFVETPDPLASKVGYSLIENSECVLYLTFENVPMKKLSDVKVKLEEVLNGIVEGSDGLDLERLHNVLRRHILEALSHLEGSPHDSVAFMLVGDCIYGSTKEDLDHRLNQVDDMHLLLSEPKDFWLGLIRKYLVDAPSVVVRGVPSKRKREEMEEEEKKRIEAQRGSLGSKGLAEKERELTAATEENEKPPPESLLRGIPIPSISSIHFHPINSYTSDKDQLHPSIDLASLPFRFHLDDLRTNFVYIFIVMDTSQMAAEMRPYLPLLLESLLESPMTFKNNEGGEWAKSAGGNGSGEKLVGHEEVVARLEADTVSVDTHLGLHRAGRFTCGPFSHTAVLGLQVEPSKYSRGVEWARDILKATKITPDRLRTIAAKMVNDVAQARRKGNSVTSALMRGLIYSKSSNYHASGLMRQHKFLSKLLERLNYQPTAPNADACASDPSSNEVAATPVTGDSGQEAAVISEIEAARSALISPSNVAVHIAANVSAMNNRGLSIIEPWTKFMPRDTTEESDKKLKVTPDWQLIHEWIRQNDPEHVFPGHILGMGCVESGFLEQSTSCINDLYHQDLPALLLFIQYLTQLEGPMWRQIRGLGLAYGYNINPRIYEGLVYLTLYRSTNVVGAYREAKNIVEAQLEEDATWEEALLESARSSLIFEVIEREKSVRDVVSQSLLSYFKGIGHDYSRHLVSLIPNVTVEDLKRVGKQLVAPLFDPKRSMTTIVCHPSKVEEVVMGFKETGRTLAVCPSLEKSFLSDW